MKSRPARDVPVPESGDTIPKIQINGEDIPLFIPFAGPYNRTSNF